MSDDGAQSIRCAYGFVITEAFGPVPGVVGCDQLFKRRPAMKTLLVATSFAALAVYPAAACDWNREASVQDPVVAATAATTGQASQAVTAWPEVTSVAVSDRARQPVVEPPPVVLVTDRH